MINQAKAKKYCRDDISKIENYDKAIADPNQIWVCHHRLGLTLDGEHAHTSVELQRLGMYFHRPYFELIFMTPEEHRTLHNRKETMRKIGAANKGKPGTMKGKHHSAETKQKLSEQRKGEQNPMYGKPRSDETRKKISASVKANWARRKMPEIDVDDLFTSNLHTVTEKFTEKMPNYHLQDSEFLIYFTRNQNQSL